MKQVIAIITLSITAQLSWGACALSTLNGTYGAQFSGVDYDDGAPIFGITRAEFDGTGKLILRGYREGSFGSVFTAPGSGRFSIDANCQGRGFVNFYVNGVFSTKANLDMVITGTAADPTVLMMFTNPSTNVNGQAILRKIDI